MAEKKEAPKGAAKGKEVKKSGKQKKSDFYDAKGDSIVRKKKFCPKCGPGVFMAQHKDRNACGKCGYSEWGKK